MNQRATTGSASWLVSVPKCMPSGRSVVPSTLSTQPPSDPVPGQTQDARSTRVAPSAAWRGTAARQMRFRQSTRASTSAWLTPNSSERGSRMWGSVATATVAPCEPSTVSASSTRPAYQVSNSAMHGWIHWPSSVRSATSHPP